ncbi:MAG: hypothetical protein U9M98_02800 [Patescibacteria group bacterium]|nr:hypothetical protein [Patescibacteria group bacterium]
MNIDVRFLRESIGQELGIINRYQDFVDASENDEVREVLAKLRDKKKEHVVELWNLLRKFDRKQDQAFRKEEL